MRRIRRWLTLPRVDAIISASLAVYMLGIVTIGVIGVAGAPSGAIERFSDGAALVYSVGMILAGTAALHAIATRLRRAEAAAICTIAALSLEHGTLVLAGSDWDASAWQTGIRIGIAPLMMVPFSALRVGAERCRVETLARIENRSRDLESWREEADA